MIRQERLARAGLVFGAVLASLALVGVDGGVGWAQTPAPTERGFQTTSPNGRFMLTQAGGAGGRCTVTVTEVEGNRTRWTSARCFDRASKLANDGDTVVEVIESLRLEDSDGVRVFRRGRQTKVYKACQLMPDGSAMQRGARTWTWLDLAPSFEENGTRLVLQVLGGFRVVLRMPDGEVEGAVRRRCRLH